MKNIAAHQSITVGELCQAIAEGQVSVTLHKEQWYQISARDLRRFVSHQRQGLPTGGKRTRPLPTM